MPSLHHVTAICGSAQANVDFYVGVLGLRLVKRTVNFDDPGTYHLYYGDAEARPGSILTFFPWAHAVPGHSGAGMATATALSVPCDSLDAWRKRLAAHGVAFDAPAERLGDAVLALRDPDGMHLELVASAPAADDIWPRGFDGVTLASAHPRATARVLREVFGFEPTAEKEGWTRFSAAHAPHARHVDVRLPGTDAGRPGRGTVHHIAFRARDAEHQQSLRRAAAALGLRPTDVLDRQYFRSVYFREPGGVLFEIATDAPGFAVDEAPGALGRSLMLPSWLEPRRAEIESALPALRVPEAP